MKRMGRDLIEPQSIVVLAWESSRDAFVDEVGDAVLIVRLDELEGELAKGLRAMDAKPGAGTMSGPTLAFETRTENELPRRNSRPAPRFGAAELDIYLARGSHFVAPLRKRPEAGKAFSERVSIGRARNNDVVLRHESVSKFHTWFKRDEDGAWLVGDASSRNGTRLSGVELAPNRQHRVSAGDTLVIGAVEALFAPTTILFDALRGSG